MSKGFLWVGHSMIGWTASLGSVGRRSRSPLLDSLFRDLGKFSGNRRWASVHFSQMNFPHCRQNPVVSCFLQFSHVMLFASDNFFSWCLSSKKSFKWKALGRPETPSSGSGNWLRQTGQLRTWPPPRGRRARLPRHFSQNECRHGRDLGSVNKSRQTAQFKRFSTSSNALIAVGSFPAILHFLKHLQK